MEDSAQGRKIRPQRERTPKEVRIRAQEIYNETPTPGWAEIARRLQSEFPDEKRVPTTGRAVSDWAKKGWIYLDIEDAPWSMADGDPEDAALVLPLLRLDDDDRRDHAQRTMRVPARRRPTKRQAEWVARMRRAVVAFAVPTVEDWVTIERLAILASRGGPDLERVELYLAYEGWKPEGRRALAAAVADKLVGREIADLDDALLFEIGMEEQRRARAAAQSKEAERGQR